MMPMQWCQVVPSVLLALVLNVPRILEMTPVNRIQWNCSVNQYCFNLICLRRVKYILEVTPPLTMKLINKRRQLSFFPKLKRFAHANKIMRSTLKPHLKQLYIKGSIFSRSHHSLYQAQLNRAKLWDLGKHWPQIIGKNHLRNYLWPLLMLLSKCVAHLVELAQVQAPNELLMLDCESFNIFTQPSFKLLMLGGWDQPAQLVLPSLLLALPGSPCMQQCTIACVTFLRMVFAFLSFYTSYTFLKPITRWFTPCWAPSYFPSVHSSSLTCESFPGYCHLIFTWLFFFQVIVVEYRLGCYFSRLLFFDIDLVVFF